MPLSVAASSGSLVLTYTTDMNFGGSISLAGSVTYADGHRLPVSVSYGAGQSTMTFASSGGSSAVSVALVAAAPWNTQAYPEWGNPGLSGSVGASVAPDIPLVPQTCVLSKNSGTVFGGDNIIGRASGAQSGNTYNIAITSDSGGATINSTTGDYTVTTPGGIDSTVAFKVWISGGSGYDRSNDAVGTVNGAASRQVRYSLPANNSPYPIVFTFTQDGIVVGTVTRQPNDSAVISSFSVGSATGDVKVTATQKGLLIDGVSVLLDSSGNGTISIPTVANPATPTADPLSPSVSVTIPVTLPAVSLPAAGATNVWAAPVASESSNLLTNQVYREGVDKTGVSISAVGEKLVRAVKNLGDLLTGGSGTGGSGTGGTSSTPTDTEANATTAKNASVSAQAQYNGFDRAGFVNSAWSDAQAQLATMASSHASDLSSALPTTADGPVALPATTGELSFGDDIVAPIGGGVNVRIPLKPFAGAYSFMRGFFTGIREVILWAMAWIFYSRAQEKLEKIQFALSIVPQVDAVDEAPLTVSILGNSATIPGTNTAISLLKRVFVSAVIIGTVHITLAALIVAVNSRIGTFYDSGFTLSNIGNIAMSLANKSSVMGMAFGFADIVFPINAAMQFLVTWFLFSWACMGSYAVASATIKATKI